MILSQDFFSQNTIKIAKLLLWKVFIFINNKWEKLSGIINEVEAYRWNDDPASHAYSKITPRNKLMYETYWSSYVYFVYWSYYCFNITTEKKWNPWAISRRSIIPKEGIDIMIKNRNKIKNIANWPWKFCQAFGITKEQNWILLSQNNWIYIKDIWYKVKNINYWPRIGIKKWIDKNRRFWF
jgi:DNA-3-methyladenine glycosylase